MKFQYLFEVVFIRLSLKTLTSQNLKLSLVTDVETQKPVIKSGCSHQLVCRKMHRKVDLSGLEPFRFTINPEEPGHLSHGIQLSDEDASGKMIEILTIDTDKVIEDLQQNNKSEFQQNYQGKGIGLQYVIHVNKKQASVFQFNVINPKGQAAELRQSGRTKRPPELTIRTNIALLRSTSRSLEGDSKRSKETDLFKKMQEETPKEKSFTPAVVPDKPSSEKQTEKDNWQILSAIPKTLSARRIKRKLRKAQTIQPEYNKEVNQLLHSHHPTGPLQPINKLSIKLRIVILLLVLGFLFLLIDVSKKYIIAMTDKKKPSKAKIEKDAKKKQDQKEKKKAVREPKQKRKVSKGKGARVH